MRDRSAQVHATPNPSRGMWPAPTLWLWALLACAPGCKCSSDAPPRKPETAATVVDPAVAAAKAKQAALDLAAASTRSEAAAPAAGATTTDDEMAAAEIAKALAIERPEILPAPAVGIEDADLLLARCLGDLRKRTAKLGALDAARVELGAEPKPSPTPGPQLPWFATVEDNGVSWSGPADGVNVRMGSTGWVVVAGGQESAIEDEFADSFDVRTAMLLLRRGVRAGDHILKLSTLSTGPDSGRTASQVVMFRLARANLTVQIHCSDKAAFIGFETGEASLRIEADDTWTELGRDVRTRWTKLEREGRWSLRTVWLPSLDVKALASASKSLATTQDELGRPCAVRPFALIRRTGEALQIGAWCPIGVRAATPAELAKPEAATLGPISRDTEAIQAFATRLRGDGSWRLRTWLRNDDTTTVAATPLTATDLKEVTP